jgi:asparagine N-glycosylation enzyme membrane subunit Stt3
MAVGPGPFPEPITEINRIADRTTTPTLAEQQGPRDAQALTVSHATRGLIIFGLAALVRATPWQRVLTDSDGVILTPGDPYFHMWRIWNSVANSIPLAARDPFANYPSGGEILWSPAFDWILATMISWLGLSQSAAEYLCAWSPVILGATAVMLAAQIAANTFSPVAGWLTGLFLAVLPGNYLYSRLGYLDHHAAVTLIGTLMLGGAMYVVSEHRRVSRFWPVLGGALCAFALSIWTGALLHIGVLQIAMLVWGPAAKTKDRAVARTFQIAAAHALTAVAIWPLSTREWEIFGGFHPLVLTLFQPIFFGAGAICLASAAALWRFSATGATRLRRLLSLSTLGAVGLMLAFTLIPELTVVLDRSAGWFTGDVEFLSNISETAPLFSNAATGLRDGEPIWTSALTLFSWFFFVLPLSMLMIVWKASRPERWLLLFWTTAFCVLTLAQNRFMNTFSIPYVIVCGAAVSVLIRWLKVRIANSQIRKAAVAFVGLVVALIVLVPAWRFYEPEFRPNPYSEFEARRSAFRAAARWLAGSRPSATAMNRKQTAGLLTNWGMAHEIRYYSNWPMNQDGFGPYVSPQNVKLANRYFEAQNEDTAIAILSKMRTRYVLTDSTGGGQGPYHYKSMTGRLSSYHGSGGLVNIERTENPRWVPALTRHRLVFEAADEHKGVWLYEIVLGVVVTGSATPESMVAVSLDLESDSGRKLRWATRRRADKKGEFRLRVPYATLGTTSSAIHTLGQYRLRTDRGVATFDVTEDALQRGLRIPAPNVVEPLNQ